MAASDCTPELNLASYKKSSLVNLGRAELGRGLPWQISELATTAPRGGSAHRQQPRVITGPGGQESAFHRSRYADRTVAFRMLK